MNTNRLKESFARAPSYTKGMLISAALLTISVFLPWYQDTDAFHTGDQFLGVTGPLSFIGIAIFALAAASLLFTCYKVLGRRLIKMPWKESSLHVFVSAQSFFLLAVTNSVYLDVKFGVNITMKEMLFGMSLALLSAIGLGVSSYFMKKHESTNGSHDTEGDLKPLIRVAERSHGTMQSTRASQPTGTSHSSANDEMSAQVREVESQQMGF